MSFNYSPKIATNGLVLYLDAANPNSYPGSGTTWSDLSRNSYNGTLTNGPTFNGLNGGSIVFDGVDDYASFGSAINPTTSFSCGAWINFTSTTLAGSDTAFLSKWNLSAASSRNFIFGYRVSGAQKGISFYLYDSSYTQQDNYRTDWNPTTNVWYHIFGVFSASNFVKIYVNAIEDYSRTSGVYSSLNPNSTENIVSGRLTGLSYFPGKIAALTMYNRALSAQEISQNYNALKNRFGL